MEERTRSCRHCGSFWPLKPGGLCPPCYTADNRRKWEQRTIREGRPAPTRRNSKATTAVQRGRNRWSAPTKYSPARYYATEKPKRDARKAERTCAICGATYKQAVGSSRKHCANCVPVAAVNRAEAKKHSATKPWVNCDTCGKLVPDAKGSRKRRYCSYACAGAGRRHARQDRCAWPNPKHPIASSITIVQCSFCDRLTVKSGPRSRRPKWCSERCRAYGAGHRPLSVSVRYPECRRCGKIFCCPASRLDECCSARCAKAYRKRLREHIKRTRSDGEKFGIREIAERDNWTCHLCGERVPDKHWDGDIDCATLDHLIPVSAGGKHVRANVKLAHFMCNTLRGATPLEDIHAEQRSFALSG